RLVAVVLVVLAAVPVAVASPAAGQPASSTTTIDPGATGAVPRPNSGAPPEDAGDRGGWAQGLVFVLTLAGLAAIVVLVVRSSRRARAAVSDRPPPAASA
ncbi:MAG TPA: hypothetical protein VGB14_05295, partial [Acidimicrobiales bacterium]